VCYNARMTRKDIKEALDRVLTWPRERQEDVVRVLAEMEEFDGSDYQLSDEQVAEVIQQLDAGQRDGGLAKL
jgi:hypothetical protein